MTLTGKAELYRWRALLAERRAREVTDPAVKRQWSELAIEWHAISSFAYELSHNNGRRDG